MKAAGTPVQIAPTEKQFSADDVREAQTKELGMAYLLRSVAERNGLLPSLRNSLPGIWSEVFMLASFLLVTGDPFVYCADWVERADSLPVGNMSSQRVSEILAAIGVSDRERFYRAWCRNRSEREYLALDITSASSYSELIDEVEWGYNRDKEDLAQINICMLMGEQSMLPVYQTIYSGSIRDVSTLDTTLSEFDCIAGRGPHLVVMDKGFYSKGNVDEMLRRKHRFVLSVPFTAAFARRQVESERKDIDSVENTIVVGSDSMRGVTKRRSWGKEHDLYTHVYFNAKKYHGARESLLANVSILKEEAESNPQKYVNSEIHSKYLSIRKSAKNESGYSITIRSDVLEKQLATTGWLVLISNDVPDAKRAIRIYRAKDVVEKGFLRLKKSLDIGRLRVHSSERMLNKVFVGFIALIMLSEINKVMTDKSLYRDMTMQQLIRCLSKLRVTNIAGTRIVYPATKLQKSIFEAFDVPLPT
jgi:transposase